MTDSVELIVTSALNDKIGSVNMWNPRTGTNLGVYRGGGTVPSRGLEVAGGYIISAEQNKPLLHAWPLNKQQCDSTRLILPGKVTALAASPDLVYIAVGVEENLHIYQTSTGHQVATGTGHFQTIRVVKFNYDGMLLGCGSEDGLLTVWNIGKMLAKGSNSAQATFSFNAHTLPVNDICFSVGDLRARIFSISMDRTCKVYNLSGGTLLLSLVFDACLTSVTLKPTETALYIGSVEGKIFEISLHEPPRNTEYHMPTSESIQQCFNGHTKAVNCLSCSLDCNLLLSGSLDETVKVWHITSRQCLRTLTHKGPVLNAFFFIPPRDIFSHSFKPRVILQNFVRVSDLEDGTESVISVMTNFDSVRRKPLQLSHSKPNSNASTKTASYSSEKEEYLDKINHNLLKFAMDKILKRSITAQLKKGLQKEAKNDLLLDLDIDDLKTQEEIPVQRYRRPSKKQRKSKSKVDINSKKNLASVPKPKPNLKKVKRGKVKKNKV